MLNSYLNSHNCFLIAAFKKKYWKTEKKNKKQNFCDERSSNHVQTNINALDLEGVKWKLGIAHFLLGKLILEFTGQKQ